MEQCCAQKALRGLFLVGFPFIISNGQKLDAEGPDSFWHFLYSLVFANKVPVSIP